MPAFNFQPKFAEDVKSGKKCQTIRPRRQRQPKVGEELQLYTGQRTANCQLLCKVTCRAVRSVEIHVGEIWVEQECLTGDALEEFAQKDGFKDADDFFQFFHKTYCLTAQNPLTEMQLIEW